MATNEDDLLREAIDSTEKEIFGDAFGQESTVHDDTGDRTNEQMGDGLEGQHEPPDDEAEDEESEDESEGDGEQSEGEEGESEGEGEGEEAEEGEGEGQGEGEGEAAEAAAAEPPPQGRVPSGRLREQTERAERAEAALRAAQAERDTERTSQRAELDGLKQQFAGVLSALQGRAAPAPSPPAPPTPEAAPDVFENPQGYTDFFVQRQDRANAETRHMLGVLRFQNSMDIARAVHGEKFSKAWDAVNKLDAQKPDEFAVAQRIFNAADPGGELLKWHARQETLRVVGDDPEKFRQTITAEVREAMRKDPEFRKQMLDDLRAEAGGAQPSKPARHITRLPKSLNGAAGQGSNREQADADLYDNSEQSVWNSAWR